MRSGNKHFDEHCLPSTISGEMKEVVNMYRSNNFLAYLQCWKLCEYYGLPLTEDVLMKGKSLGGRASGRCQEGPELSEGGIDSARMHPVKPLWPVVGTLGRGSVTFHRFSRTRAIHVYILRIRMCYEVRLNSCRKMETWPSVFYVLQFLTKVSVRLIPNKDKAATN